MVFPRNAFSSDGYAAKQGDRLEIITRLSQDLGMPSDALAALKYGVACREQKRRQVFAASLRRFV